MKDQRVEPADAVIKRIRGKTNRTISYVNGRLPSWKDGVNIAEESASKHLRYVGKAFYSGVFHDKAVVVKDETCLDGGSKGGKRCGAKQPKNCCHRKQIYTSATHCNLTNPICVVYFFDLLSFYGAVRIEHTG